MPKDELTREKSHRHSLQPKSSASDTSLRHTQSQNYGVKRAKKRAPKAIPAPIKEDPDDATTEAIKVKTVANLIIEDEKRLSRTKSNSQRSTKSSRSAGSSSHAYDNAGFEGQRELRSSSRQPSLQSLTVAKEQYCCCSRRTRCERGLIIAVSVLVLIIIVLIIVIGVIAKENSDNDIKTTIQNLLH